MAKNKIIALGVLIIMAISLAACENTKGSFYSLQEAYDEGLLTVEDLQSIASYNPENGSLGAEKEHRVKESYALYLRSQTYLDGSSKYPEATTADVTIERYSGTYNNCVAVMISDIYTDYNATLWEITIAGVLFHYSDGNRIIIWNGK